MRIVYIAINAAIIGAAQIVTAPPALAQGCILLRQTSPMFGTTGALNDEVGTWNVTFTGRNSTADKHYNGTVRQVQREQDGTYVVNRQNSLTATISYQLTPRLNLNAGIPFVEASWGIPSPRSGGPAARANENARGIGDITTLARFSLVSPTTHHSWNLQLGGGLKLPTGNSKAVDMFPDGNGSNNAERYVDISANPGDGGWGMILDVQGFKSVGRFMPFGSGTWLLNPRDLGGPSRGNVLTNPNPTNVNTVSDQFVFRAGTSVVVTRHVTASIAWRMEGVPRYDLIGRSDGFRRPGVEMYLEPGVTMTTGRHMLSLNLPFGYYFNRFRNPYTGTPGDSTFPEVVAIATYSMRLGRNQVREPVITDQPQSPGGIRRRDENQDQSQN